MFNPPQGCCEAEQVVPKVRRFFVPKGLPKASEQASEYIRGFINKKLKIIVLQKKHYTLQNK
jgi:hypothetical protein